MAAVTNHPYIKQPKDEEKKVWRYMSFTKLIDLLSNQRLYLNRADSFKDNWEGMISQATFNNRTNNLILRSYQDETQRESIIKRNNFVRNWTYINCWHMNESESAAMWDLYSDSKDSIAIETTYKNLTMNLPSNTFIGCVEYINYAETQMPIENQFTTFLYKRKSFSHENEIRIVMQDERRIVNQDGYSYLKEQKDHDENDFIGEFIKINVEDLIDTIHVSPTAKESFLKLVEKVVKKDYNLDIKVKQSDLYKDPIY